jgi:hypothetical protein
LTSRFSFENSYSIQVLEELVEGYQYRHNPQRAWTDGPLPETPLPLASSHTEELLKSMSPRDKPPRVSEVLFDL